MNRLLFRLALLTIVLVSLSQGDLNAAGPVPSADSSSGPSKGTLTPTELKTLNNLISGPNGCSSKLTPEIIAYLGLSKRGEQPPFPAFSVSKDGVFHQIVRLKNGYILFSGSLSRDENTKDHMFEVDKRLNVISSSSFPPLGKPAPLSPAEAKTILNRDWAQWRLIAKAFYTPDGTTTFFSQ